MNVKQRVGIGLLRVKFKMLALLSRRRTAEKAFALFTTPLSRAVNKDFKPEEQIQFDLDGLTIRGFRWNHPQPKKALIIHGFSSAAFKFEHYVQPLIDKGYEVVAFDAPGHGLSDGKTVNALSYSSMLVKAIELFGPFNSYIAHSFGGLGLSLALEKLPHTADTKMVLIAPATETTSAIDGAFALFGLQNAGVRKEVDDIIYRLGGKSAEWFSIRRAVNNITAQILWVHDEQDDITPLSDAVKVKEDNHSHINFVITNGLGHNKIYRDAAIKKLIIDFL